MYGGLGMSAPSLHRESTDSLLHMRAVDPHQPPPLATELDTCSIYVQSLFFVFMLMSHSTTLPLVGADAS